MDKITKFLLNIPKKSSLALIDALEKIHMLKLENLDIKKMKWEKNKYRMRIWQYRIIFQKNWKHWEIIKINTRGTIYK